MRRESKIIARFLDEDGEERIVHKRRGGEIRVKRREPGTIYTLSVAVGAHIGMRVREERLKRGWTLLGLARRTGLSGSAGEAHLKQRMREIEINALGGIKLGTLYALAHALNMEPGDLLPSKVTAFADANLVEVAEPRLTVGA